VRVFVQADVARNTLNRISLYGQVLGVTPSRHTSLLPTHGAAAAAAAASSAEIKEFLDSPHHRFKRGYGSRLPNMPCQTIYFTNGSPSLTEDALLAALASVGAPTPREVRFLNNRTDGGSGGGREERKVGFIDFPNLEQCILTLALANNTLVDGNPVRMAFASRPSNPERATRRDAAPATGGGGSDDAAMHGGSGGVEESGGHGGEGGAEDPGVGGDAYEAPQGDATYGEHVDGTGVGGGEGDGGGGDVAAAEGDAPQ